MVDLVIADAVDSVLLRTPDSDLAGVPSIAFSPDFSTTSSPLSSAPTTPDIASELLVAVSESYPGIVTSHSNSWEDILEIEEGLRCDSIEYRSTGLSFLGSSTSIFSKLSASFLVPSQSISPSKFLQPSTPCRTRSNSLLPQFTQDITSPSYKADTSWNGDGISMIATPGGTPPQSPGCYTSVFDFSMYEADRRFGRIMDKKTLDAALPLTSSTLLLPVPITPSRYHGDLPAICTPNNSPEKERRVPGTLDAVTLVQLLEDPTKMHRPANTGLRPLLLPCQAAKRHSLDLTAFHTRQRSGPRPLMLPQQLAKRPAPPTRSSTLDVGIIHGRQSSFMRKSMSVQDCRSGSSQHPDPTSPPRQSRLFSDILTLLKRNDDSNVEPLVDLSTTTETDEPSQQRILPSSSLFMSPESSMIMESIDQEGRLLAIIGLLDDAMSREDVACLPQAV